MMTLVDPGKFSAEVLRALSDAGWTPDREVDVANLLSILDESGFRPHLLARVVLESFYGLIVEPVNRRGPGFPNGEPLTFDPLAAADHAAPVKELEKVLGGHYFPLGEWLSHSNVYLEAGGRMVADDSGQIIELGKSFEEGVEYALLVFHPLVVLHEF
jgi:hypothetical protein